MKVPWKPADATTEIRKLGASTKLHLTYSNHAKEQMLAREQIISDALYVLKNGFVYLDGAAATQPTLWKYQIETRTPNSGNRIVRLVVIPDKERTWVKIVTVMWADE